MLHSIAKPIDPEEIACVNTDLGAESCYPLIILKIYGAPNRRPPRVSTYVLFIWCVR